MQRRKVHRKKAADTWSVLLFCREISKRSIMPHIRFRSDVYRSFVSHSRPLLYPIFSPSPSPSFLLARSISFSPSSFLLLPPPDRKQIRDTAAAQQQVARFACRVFRVTRGNRHGNLIFTEKLITRRLVYIHDRVSCIVQGILPPGAGNGRPFIAWPPIPEREREREREKKKKEASAVETLLAIVIGDWQKAAHTSFYYSYDFARDKKSIFIVEVRLLFPPTEWTRSFE